MLTEIERLMFKLRKECYAALEKRKRIPAKIYFFIATETGLSEIMVPGVDEYMEDDHSKDQLQPYLEKKWREYYAKGGYRLEAVMMVSDSWFAVEENDGKSPQEVIERPGYVAPSKRRDRKEAISFAWWTRDQRKAIYFEYVRNGRKIQWGKSTEDMDFDPFSRFYDMFPASAR